MHRQGPGRRRLVHFLSAALICAAASCQTDGTVRDRAIAPAAPLRAMTFNIRYGTAGDGDNRWERRREMVIGVLREHRPQVAGLQEALRFQLDEIRAALPHFMEIGVGRDDGRTAGEYAAILYDEGRFTCDESGTFWLSETPETPGSRSWGAACTRICTWARLIGRGTDRGLSVFNVHLDHESAEARARGIEVVLRRMNTLARSEPVLLMGDFNAAPDSETVRRVLSGGNQGMQDLRPGGFVHRFAFVDVFAAMHPGATGDGTYNGFAGRREGPRIDYLFATPELVPREARIVHDHEGGRYPSDHFPVMAVLDWQ